MSHILEALKPSEYRQFMNTAKIAGSKYKTDFDKVFRQYADSSDKNAYRIYIPLNAPDIELTPPGEIELYLKKMGYTVSDYAAGIATSLDSKKIISIGKLVAKDPEIKKIYDNDPQRSGLAVKKGSEYVAVISRHPYDIAGMSTNRGWTSCMSLDKEENSNYICANVSGMTLVAYAVKISDTNISKPAGRILIQCFVNINIPGDYIMVPGEVYGSDVAGFSSTIIAWCNKHWPAKSGNKYSLDPDKYDDGIANLHVPLDLVNASSEEVEEKFPEVFGFASPKEYRIKVFKDKDTGKSDVSLVSYNFNVANMMADRLPANIRNITSNSINLSDNTFNSLSGLPKKFTSLDSAMNDENGNVDINILDMVNLKSLNGLPTDYQGVKDLNLKITNYANRNKLTDMTAIDNINGVESINLNISISAFKTVKEFPKKVPFNSVVIMCISDASGDSSFSISKPLLIADNGIVSIIGLRYTYTDINLSNISGTNVTVNISGGFLDNVVVGRNISTITFTKEIPKNITYTDGSKYTGTVELSKAE